MSTNKQVLYDYFLLSPLHVNTHCLRRLFGHIRGHHCSCCGGLHFRGFCRHLPDLLHGLLRCLIEVYQIISSAPSPIKLARYGSPSATLCLLQFHWLEFCVVPSSRHCPPIGLHSSLRSTVGGRGIPSRRGPHHTRS